MPNRGSQFQPGSFVGFEAGTQLDCNTREDVHLDDLQEVSEGIPTMTKDNIRRPNPRIVAKHIWEPLQPPEPSLEEQPLLLISGTDPATSSRGPKPVGMQTKVIADDSNPQIVLWDEGRRCFATHWKKLLPADVATYAVRTLLEHAPWQELHSKKGLVTRETCWFVRSGCRCDYTYGTARVRAKKKASLNFRLAMERLLNEIMGRLCPWMPKDAWPNCANLNLYTEDAQSVGWHADDENLFMGRERDCPIISVSLGAQREFWIALRQETNSMEPEFRSILEVDLSDGDVLTMEGLMQKHCVHFVPCNVRNDHSSDESRNGIRINVTWRWIREHKLKCPKREPEAEFPPIFCDFPGSLKLESLQLLSSSWTSGKPMAWRTCDGCDHDAWRGGRNCVKYQKQWLCRLCFQFAAVEGGTIPLRPPGERRRPLRRRLPESAVVSLDGSNNLVPTKLQLASAVPASFYPPRRTLQTLPDADVIRLQQMLDAEEHRLQMLIQGELLRQAQLQSQATQDHRSWQQSFYPAQTYQ